MRCIESQSEDGERQLFLSCTAVFVATDDSDEDAITMQVAVPPSHLVVCTIKAFKAKVTLRGPKHCKGHRERERESVCVCVCVCVSVCLSVSVRVCS